ncbi:MAG: hypothetical protein J6T72_02035 [Alphaproteobacteria bacterium]|nr:hypothetical protein [Alphaproteobacteria bacterium]
MEKLTVNAHQIDRDAYVKKNELMSHFDKAFGTQLMKSEADDLTFLDIIMAASQKASPFDIYAEIKSVVGHGVTQEQKKFLYKFFPFFSATDPDDDYEAMIDVLETAISKTERAVAKGLKFVDGTSMCICDENGLVAVATYHREPFSILRVQAVASDEMQAILVQNGKILILEVVNSEEKFSNPFEQE